MWIITEDHTDGKSVGVKSRDYDGRFLPFPFRLLDDDGELYYEGRSDDNDSERAFAPLDDFGMPDSGCTDIQYIRNGKWESL